MKLSRIKEVISEKLKIYLFPLVGFFILVIGIALTFVLIQRAQNMRSRALISNASIDLPLMKSIFVGNDFDVPVTIKNDNKEVIGADLVINYDKNLLQLLDIFPNINSGLNYFLPVATSGVFNKTKVIQDGNTAGKIFFSAICYSNGPCPKGLSSDLTETNPLATLRFRALALGNTAISIDFIPDGSTTDSNLESKDGQDILGKVTNMSLNIAPITTLTPNPTNTPAMTITPSPSAQVTATPAPVGGYIIYDDAFKNGFVANTDATTLITTSRSDQKASGAYSMELNLFAYRTPYFYQSSGSLNSSNYNYLEFDAYFLNGPSGPVPHLYVSLANTAYSSSWTQVTAAGSGSSIAISADSGWKHIKIPFSSFAIPTNTSFAGLTINDREPWPGNDSNADLWGHVLIDNIMFTK